MGIYMKNSRRIEKETSDTSDLLERVRNMGIDTGVGKRLPIVYLLRVFFLFWFYVFFLVFLVCLLIVLMFEQRRWNTGFKNLNDFYYEKKYTRTVKKKKKSTPFKSLGISPFLGPRSLNSPVFSSVTYSTLSYAPSQMSAL